MVESDASVGAAEQREDSWLVGWRGKETMLSSVEGI